MSNVILVGNAKSLLDKPRGAVIDSFKDVVRFNNYQLGDASYTGTKTTIWARQAGEKVRSRDDKFQSILIFITYCKWLNILRKNASKLARQYPDASIIESTFSKVLGTKLGLDQPDRKWPSIGILAIEYFVNLRYDVTICGFSFSNDHYYPYLETDSNGHDWTAEKNYVTELADSGKLTIV